MLYFSSFKTKGVKKHWLQECDLILKNYKVFFYSSTLHTTAERVTWLRGTFRELTDNWLIICAVADSFGIDFATKKCMGLVADFNPDDLSVVT